MYPRSIQNFQWLCSNAWRADSIFCLVTSHRRAYDNGTLNETQFTQAWSAVVANASWHSNEPAFDTTTQRACAVLTQRNFMWRLAARPCSDQLSSSALLCRIPSTGSGEWPIKCLLTPHNFLRRLKSMFSYFGVILWPYDCVLVPICLRDYPNRGGLVTFSGNATANQTSYILNTTATYSCNCGQYFNATPTPARIIGVVCYGSFGWFPRDLPRCVQGMWRESEHFSHYCNDKRNKTKEADK